MCEWCCASDVYISNRIHNDTALSFPRYQCISILWDMHLFCLICSDTNTIKIWICFAIPIHTLIKFDNSLTRPQSSVYTTTLPEILCFNQQIFATTKKLLSMENLNLWVSSPRKSFCMTHAMQNWKKFTFKVKFLVGDLSLIFRSNMKIAGVIFITFVFFSNEHFFADAK